MITEAITNYTLICSFISWFAAQFIKIFTGAYRNKKFNFAELVFASGGMPSSHSAAVSALCTASFFEYGIGSFQFTVTFILALIVMRDAAGVRNQVGKQAKLLNQICEDNFSNLKELVGHTPFQVCVGSVLGIVIAVVFKLIYQI